MNLNFIFSVFAPKDKKFIPLLHETADTLLAASGLLQELFNTTDPEKRTEIAKLIKKQELKGDKMMLVLQKALYETFITPFDREDIDTLTDRLDDGIDAMNRVAHKVMIYAPKENMESSLAMVEIIRKASWMVHDGIKALTNLKKTNNGMKVFYDEIKKLEEAGDVVYEKAVQKLFVEEPNVIELIKQKEIIQELEKTVNRLNQIGKTLKTVTIKYA